MFIQDPDLYFLPIPDPVSTILESVVQKGTGSRIRIRNTGSGKLKSFLFSSCWVEIFSVIEYCRTRNPFFHSIPELSEPIILGFLDAGSTFSVTKAKR